MDTLGLLLGGKVLPANITGRQGSEQLLQELRRKQAPMKRHLFAGGGDQGKWEGWVKTTPGYSVEIVQRPDAKSWARTRSKRFGITAVVPSSGSARWWSAAFAWLSFNRRLYRAYGLLPETTEAFILLSFIRRMLRRLAAFAQQNAVPA
ncbi:hypothetical protein [Deinococcus hopiensis]|uniref:hypothetical protein n=1 Tax=Deinococcus hopiensis TaxID=309885 RepID=UPI000A00A592|nr:hypothetical protein [Deinococcus hopiensis]